MAKVITRAEFQMTPDGYELLSEESYEHDGPIAECKGGAAAGSGIDPATQAALVRQNADVNRNNTTGTYGSSSWSIDPATGRYTQRVSLDPSQQRQLDTRNSIAESMLGDASRNFGELGENFAYGDTVGSTARAGFDKFAARAKPRFQQQGQRLDQNLANGGIPLGSEAYNRSQKDLSDAQSDEIQAAASGAANTSNTQELQERQQRYSDIANLMGNQNTQTPTAGVSPAIDTIGTASGLQNNVNAMFNNAANQRQQGTNALASLLPLLL